MSLNLYQCLAFLAQVLINYACVFLLDIIYCHTNFHYCHAMTKFDFCPTNNDT